MAENKRSKFMEILTRDNSEIAITRAERFEQITKTEIDNHISSIENDIIKAQDEMDTLLDISTNNDINAINALRDWDAEEFVTKRCTLRLKIKRLNEALEVAQAERNELFG